MQDLPKSQRGFKHGSAAAGDVGEGTEQSCYSHVLTVHKE